MKEHLIYKKEICNDKNHHMNKSFAIYLIAMPYSYIHRIDKFWISNLAEIDYDIVHQSSVSKWYLIYEL